MSIFFVYLELKFEFCYEIRNFNEYGFTSERINTVPEVLPVIGANEMSLGFINNEYLIISFFFMLGKTVNFVVLLWKNIHSCMINAELWRGIWMFD